MINYGYICVSFLRKDIEDFQKLIKNACGKDDYYYSNDVSYMRGDVSNNLHLTLFYGLVSENVDTVKLKKLLNRIKIKRLELGEFEIWPGYNNLYQTLIIKVKDDNQVLKKMSRTFKQFPHDKKVQIDFIPHLTLAYVKPDFKLSGSYNYPKEIKVKEIKYFEK